MDQTKILLFDIDGTLIDLGQTQPSPKTVEALQRLKAVADDICGPVSQDGICHYCLQHGLI